VNSMLHATEKYSLLMYIVLCSI